MSPLNPYPLSQTDRLLKDPNTEPLLPDSNNPGTDELSDVWDAEMAQLDELIHSLEASLSKQPFP